MCKGPERKHQHSRSRQRGKKDHKGVATEAGSLQDSVAQQTKGVFKK